jgi:hypothetical protein
MPDVLPLVISVPLTLKVVLADDRSTDLFTLERG